MPTVAEQRFLERVPNLLYDLTKELEKLNKNLETLNTNTSNNQ